MSKSEINLIPEDYRIYTWKLDWLKRYSLIAAAVFILSGLTYGAMTIKVSSLKNNIQKLSNDQQLITQQRQQFDQLRTEKDRIDRELELLKRLRSSATVEYMFEVLDRAIIKNDLWLVNLEFKREEVKTDKPASTRTDGYFIVISDDGKSRETWGFKTHLVVKGRARDHAVLSEFVKRISEQSDIKSVKLKKTTLRKYTTASVVDFDLTIVLSSSTGDT